MIQGTLVFSVEPGDEVLEPGRFLAKVAGGANQLFQFRQGSPPDPVDRQRVRLAESVEGSLHVAPGSVLCEERTDDDFKGRIGRPPVLPSPEPPQGEENGLNAGLRCFWHSTQESGWLPEVPFENTLAWNTCGVTIQQLFWIDNLCHTA